MVISNFDGMNFTLTMSPRELKLLGHGLEQLNSDAFLEVAKHMQAAGFDHAPRDVMAVLRQHALCLMAMGSAIRESSTVPVPEEQNDDEPTKKKELPN